MRSRGLNTSVAIIDRIGDVREFLEKSYATILPVKKSILIPDFPASLMESLACGRPVICSTVIAMGKFLREHGGGVSEVFDPADGGSESF